jgi:ribonuclease P protein component
MPDDRSSFRFPHEAKLSHKAQFDAVFAARTAVDVWPLRVMGLPNDAGRHRLGLVTSRRVGNAVRRNRIRRLLRESFRLLHHDWPGAYDLVVLVAAHEPLELAKYQLLLSGAVERLHQRWATRKDRT